MIIDIWKPIRKGSGNNKKIIHYQLYDLNKFFEEEKKGYVVRYTCDMCLSDNIYTTTSSTFYRKDTLYNTLKSQTCRSCRTRISEYEIKKSQIPYNKIKESFKISGYTLLTSKKLYEMSDNKSQMKLESICDKNHNYYCTWNNWNRGKRCLLCYNDDKKNNAIKYKYGFDLYHYIIWRDTNINYKNYKKYINPNNLKRGRYDYHIDHIYSIYDGFKNNIPTHIISSPCNLRMLSGSKNISKGKKSDITIDELLEKMKTYNN